MRLLKRLLYVVRQRKLDRELREELEVHRAMVQDRLETQGQPSPDAAAGSRRVLGNVTRAREDARAVYIAPWLESLWQDAAYAVRTFARRPGVTCVAGGALAAAIGLNTSLFSVFSALTLREWPVPDAHRVVRVFNMSSNDLRARGGGGPLGFSLDEVRYFSAHARTMTGFVVTRIGGGDKTLGEEDVPASWVSGNYFSVLGVPFALGRGFGEDEDRSESPAAVAVLSYGFWQRRFGGDPSILGTPFRFDDVPFTIVGVTARSFTGTLPEPVDVWMPLGSSALLRPDDRYVRNVVLTPANCCSALAGRLIDRATRAEAEAELNVLDRRFRGPSARNIGVRLTGTELTASPMDRDGGGFYAMFAGSLLVLLLACANVANLLIARAAARQREIGVRLSIDASRPRVVRQLMTESLVLALGAAAVGLMLALWLPAQLVRWTGANPSALQLTPDATVLGFALALTCVAALTFGLVPALHGVRSGIAGALRNAPWQSGRVPVRGLLLSLQVVVAVILLISAALIGNAIRRIIAKDLGFAEHDIAVASVEAPARGFDAARTRAVSQQMVDAFASHPATVLTSTAPLGSGNIKGSFRLADGTSDYGNSVYEISPRYFEFLRIPIVAGRGITVDDRDRPVIVINESMANQFWTSATAAIGQHIVSEPGEGGHNRPGTLEIVGVVRDVHTIDLRAVGHTIYQPLSGRGLPQVLVIDSQANRASIAKAIAAIAPELRVRIAPLSGNMAPHLRSSRTAAMLAGAMGFLALALAAVAIFAVFVCWVQQRTHEIGVRVALGASSSQVVALLLRSSGMAIGSGVLTGLVGGAVASRVLRSYLFGLSSVDPIAYLVALIVVASAATVATCEPARRAARVDPVHALRYE